MGYPTDRALPKISSSSVTLDDQLDIVVLGAAELRRVLSPERCLAALEDAYASLHRSPDERGQSVEFKADRGKFHVKAGLSPRTHAYFAAKVNANFPDNPSLFGLPTIQGLIVLCKADNGRPVAILHSGELTGQRTAAATALAAKHGARRNSHKLAMIGCGVQARYQLEAVLAVLPIKEVIAYDNDERNASAFAAWVERNFAVAIKTSGSVKDAVRASAVCITCTTATRAIIDRDTVPVGCFIAAVGADNPDKQEIDPRIFAEARVIVDDLKQASTYGDLAHALRLGAVEAGDVDATLADLVAGAKSGRTHTEEIVVFDSTGTGVQDVAVSAAAYEFTLAPNDSKKSPV